MSFRKKGIPKKAQHSFPKIGVGASEAVWKFSENSANLVQVMLPYLCLCDSPFSMVLYEFINCRKFNFHSVFDNFSFCKSHL